MSTNAESDPPEDHARERRRPDWMTSLVLPVAVAVVGAIAVAALTPAGDRLREFLFPTSADVTGSVSVAGHPAAGARLTLDGEHVGNAGEQGTFRISDVGDGRHSLLIHVTGAKAQREEFRVERGEQEVGVAEIELQPLFSLGYYADLTSLRVDPRTQTVPYDITLWIVGDGDSLAGVQSVTYTPPAPLAGTVVRTTRAQAFCFRWIGRMGVAAFGTLGASLATADLVLGAGRTFELSAKVGTVQPASPCDARQVANDGQTTTGGGGGGGGTTPPAGDRVHVPAVVGRPLDVATSVLAAASLRPRVTNVPDDAPAGTVIGQRPAAGTEVTRSAIVDLRVSSGPGAAHVSVPPVVDLTYEAAVEALQGLGFVVTQREAESDREAGVVIAQAPAAGTQAVPGSTVTVTVSTGDAVTVPDVVGQTIDEAKQTLQDANLEVTTVAETTSDPSLVDTVIEQSPAAGAEAQPGDVVTLTYGDD